MTTATRENRSGPLPPPPGAAELVDPSALGARPELLPALRDGLQSLDEALAARFRDGEDVETLVQTRAWGVERLLLHAWERTLADAGGLALVAVGGFGRGQLHPHSDIDLLILFAGDALNDEQRDAIEGFVALLWDAGFYLGHSVRNVEQCRQEMDADVATATSLMEARLLTGPETLFERLREEVESDRSWDARAFFDAKLEEQRRRHEQYGETAYNLEPNVKECPGGLRDIQMIGWVAKRHFGATDLHGLVEHGFLTESEYDELIEGRRHLWRVRFALHLLAGRAEDRLLFDFQRQTAEWFGYRDEANSNQAVERFMQRYYRVVTALERLNERLLQLFREELLSDRRQEPEPLGEDFCIRQGYLDVRDEGLFRRRPEALMELFVLMARHERLQGVRASAIRLVVDHLHLVNDAFRGDPRVLELFMELLAQKQGVYTQLQRMNRYGVLAAFLPAFGQIVGRMQFDLFHVYTVDQHILFTVRNLRRFAYGKYRDTFPHAPEVFDLVENPSVLYLAALFHDIAKGRGGDHSELGAVDAREFCARLPLGEEDRELVAWLVERHLFMSQTAQKKDIGDPETVRAFAQAVGSRRRLRHLYLLTVADIAATSPRLWNSWKCGLLWELYQATLPVLERDPEAPVDRGEHIDASRDAVLAELEDAGVDGEAVRRFWRGLPASTFLRFSASQLAWATREVLAAPADAPLIAVRNREDREVTEILVCAADYTGLFATTTAVMDELGLNVLSARVVTDDDRRTFDLFQVMDRHGGTLNEVDCWTLVTRLRRALASQEVLRPVRRPMPRRLRPFLTAPEIQFRGARDGRVTELEVRCTDRPGLLSQLADAIVASGVRIHDAMIATFGDRVEDIFLVTDRDNRPLGGELEQRLAREIEQRLETPAA